MSQVKFETTIDGKTVKVCGGWDNPLQHFFLTIFNPEDDEEECFWSGLDHFPDMGGTQNILDIKNVLSSFKIVPPDGFYALILLCEGNVFHSWKNGKWETYGNN